MLEVLSCGLSWDLILKKREHLNQVFDNFDPDIVSKYTDEKVEELMADPGIIRNKQKIRAIINNAQIYLKITQETTFDSFLWKYVNYKPIVNLTNTYYTHSDISDKLSKDLKGPLFQHRIQIPWNNNCLFIYASSWYG